MAEKVIYEVALKGIAEAYNAIGGLENRLSNVRYGGIVALNKELAKTTSLLHVVGAVSATGTKTYNKSLRLSVAGLNKKLVTAGFMANMDELRRQHQSTGFLADIHRAYNKLTGDWGTLKDRRNGILGSVLGKTGVAPLLLGWNGESNPTFMDEVERQRKERLKNRGWKIAADLPKPNFPWWDRRSLKTETDENGNERERVVTNTSLRDAPHADFLKRMRALFEHAGSRQQLSAYISKANPKLGAKLAALKGAANVFGTFAIGLWAFNKLISVIGKTIERFKQFGDVVLQATESWRQLRESHYYGTSMGSLASQWKSQLYLGGDAASASALWNKLSTERAMLAFGGNGGSMMEAARLFGVGILGSGEHGFATNDEFMRNVVKRMTQLTPEGRKALGNTLGLNPYQFWAVSNGEEYYNFLTKRPTLLGQIRGAAFGEDVGNEIFSKDSTDAARRFEGAWGEFVVSLKELGGVLGEAILPALTILLDMLTGLAQIVTTIIKPIAWILNKFFNLLSVRFWSEEEALKDSPTQAQVQSRIVAAQTPAAGNNVTLNFGDISLNSLGLNDDASEDQIRDKITNVIWNRLGNHLINDRK